MSIKLLPEDVIAQIKSSVIITSLNGVAYGLLQNSLDAKASKISISIDYARGNCSVEDDGLGIPPADFKEDGGLGRLYYTSRYPPRAECHGRHGTFLASLATLSLLSVASHHREYRSHNSLTMHNSKVVARNMPALPEQEILAHASGTRVTVRDLFGSMPVRVRQRAIEAERLGSTKNFDQLLLSIVALLLPWPDEVALTVLDVGNHRTVSLNPRLARHVHNQSIPGNATCLPTAGLVSQASLSEGESLQSWVPLEASAPGMSVVGCVSLQPVVTKRVQFIALGVQPLLNESQSNVLYEEVNKVFANSSFGAIEDGPSVEADGPTKPHGFTQRALKVRKGVDRWPMFFLQVNLGGGLECLDVDAFLDERRGSLARIINLLQITAYRFLKKHHFHPKAVHAFQELKFTGIGASSNSHKSMAASMKTTSGRTSAQARAAPRPSTRRSTASAETSGKPTTSPFASWSRLKLASTSSKRLKSSSSSISPLISESGSSRQDDGRGSPGSLSPTTWSPHFSKKGELLRKPFDDVEEPGVPNPISPASWQSSAPSTARGPQSEASDSITWVDPVTKARALINPRTGFIINPISTANETSSLSRARGIAALPERRQEAAPLPNRASSKIQIFEPTEPPVPCLPQFSELLGHEHNDHDCRDLGDINIDGPSGKISKTLESKISKDALARAEVIQQVDRKFILVKIVTGPLPVDEGRVDQAAGAPSSQTGKGESQFLLVLIDQHAADERCRVEELMQEYFSIDNGRMEARIETLAKSLRFDLSAQEGKLLERFREHFCYWGIRYELFRNIDGKGRESSRVTVEIQALPPSIAERCRLEPRLFIELLRKEIWRLNDRPGLASSVAGPLPVTHQGEYDWVAKFHQCPEGIMEMINSRSCRSAIMFNDVLTIEECRDLVGRLARCAFSFQCAHGRPSMVPLVDLGGSSDVLSVGDRDLRERGDGDLMGDLKSWAAKRRVERA